MRSPETIARHAKIWIKYGVISPLLFACFAFIAFHYNILDVTALLLIGASIAIVTCFVWWFWALGVIIDMTSMNSNAKYALTDIKKLVRMTHKELTEQRTLYTILKEEIEKEKKSK